MTRPSVIVDVECNLNVSRDTAEACLKLMEFFLNSNKGYILRIVEDETGGVKLYLIDTEEDDNENY